MFLSDHHLASVLGKFLILVASNIDRLCKASECYMLTFSNFLDFLVVLHLDLTGDGSAVVCSTDQCQSMLLVFLVRHTLKNDHVHQSPVN